MNTKSKTTWRVGSTTFNRSDQISSIKTLAKVLYDFRKINNDEWDNKTQTEFYDYINQMEPELFEINKDAAEYARQLTASVVNYNFFDEKREITKYGKIFLEGSQWIKELSIKTGLGEENIAILYSLLNLKSDNNLFNPIFEIIKYLFKEEKAIYENVLWTHKAENSEEFETILNNGISLLSVNEEDNISSKIISNEYFLNNNGSHYNQYIKDIYDYFFDLVILKRENLKQPIYKGTGDSKKRKVIKAVFNEFSEIIDSGLDITVKEFNEKIVNSIGFVYWNKTVFGQAFQTKWALYLTGIIDFKKNNLGKLELYLNKNIFNLTDINVFLEEENIITDHFKNSTFNISSTNEKDFVKEIQVLLESENDVFAKFNNDELLLIKNFPRELLIRMKRFVLLEYLTAIKLSMIMKKDIDSIIDQEKLDKNNILLSHRQGRMADFELEDFIVEVTASNGKATVKLETEPVTRHLAHFKHKNENNGYCLFFGAGDAVHMNFIYDALVKRHYKYFIDEKNFVEDLNIIPISLQNLDKITIDKIEKALSYHQNYEDILNVPKNKILNSIIVYRKGIDEIFNK